MLGPADALALKIAFLRLMAPEMGTDDLATFRSICEHATEGTLSTTDLTTLDRLFQAFDRGSN